MPVATLPPGPRFKPAVLVNFFRDPLGYYERCARRYGDPFTLPTTFGRLVITGKPDGIRAIYAAKHEIFDIFAGIVSEPFLGPTSLMLTSGDYHLRNRRLLVPLFHGKRIQEWGELMASTAARAAAGWPTGEPFVAQEAMTDVTAEIFLRVLFGDREDDVERLGTAFREVENATRPSIVYVPALRREFGGVGPWARFRRKMDRLDAVIHQIITERRQRQPGDDVLGVLIGARYEDGGAMSDGEVRDQLLSLVAAGHETLASALAWGLYRLHQHPEILARLRDELDELGPAPAADALAALPYLEAVCNETLRLNPILPEVTRLLRQPLELRGWTLPAGVAVSPMASLVHMDEEVYPEPAEFRPERFLERSYTPYEFVPFGGGSHRCLGGAFAVYEMKIVLATLVGGWRFALDSAEPVRPRRRNFPFGPFEAVKLAVEGERAVPATTTAAAEAGR